MPQMFIANRLVDGLVVFLATADDWVTDIAAGQIADNESEAAAMLARAKSAELGNQVVEPCLIDVAIENGKPQPVVYREYIRAFGPSVPLPT